MNKNIEQHPVALDHHVDEEHNAADHHDIELVVQKPRTGTDTTSDSNVDVESARDILSFHAKGSLRVVSQLTLFKT